MNILKRNEGFCGEGTAMPRQQVRRPHTALSQKKKKKKKRDSDAIAGFDDITSGPIRVNGRL